MKKKRGKRGKFGQGLNGHCWSTQSIFSIQRGCFELARLGFSCRDIARSFNPAVPQQFVEIAIHAHSESLDDGILEATGALQLSLPLDLEERRNKRERFQTALAAYRNLLFLQGEGINLPWIDLMKTVLSKQLGLQEIVENAAILVQESARKVSVEHIEEAFLRFLISLDDDPKKLPIQTRWLGHRFVKTLF